MRFEPVLAEAYFDLDGAGEAEGADHAKTGHVITFVVGSTLGRFYVCFAFSQLIALAASR
jgi:hypothetical protein